MENSENLNDRIFRVEQKWGFGMAPVKPAVQAERTRAVHLVTEVIDQPLSQATYVPAVDACSVTKGLFTRCSIQDQWDWFTVWRQLGRPGRATCYDAAQRLYELRAAIAHQNVQDVKKLGDQLASIGISDRLRHYPNEISSLQKDAGYIYILSTREAREILKIGYTTRSVEERVREINSSTGVLIPYGVRALWVVSDAKTIESDVHHLLREFRIRRDREFFEIDYKKAFEIIRNYIKASRHER